MTRYSPKAQRIPRPYAHGCISLDQSKLRLLNTNVSISLMLAISAEMLRRSVSPSSDARANRFEWRSKLQVFALCWFVGVGLVVGPTAPIALSNLNIPLNSAAAIRMLFGPLRLLAARITVNGVAGAGNNEGWVSIFTLKDDKSCLGLTWESCCPSQNAITIAATMRSSRYLFGLIEHAVLSKQSSFAIAVDTALMQ